MKKNKKNIEVIVDIQNRREWIKKYAEAYVKTMNFMDELTEFLKDEVEEEVNYEEANLIKRGFDLILKDIELYMETEFEGLRADLELERKSNK